MGHSGPQVAAVLQFLRTETNAMYGYVWAMGRTAIRIAGKRMLIPRDRYWLIRKPSFVWFPPIQSPDAPHEWRGVPSRGFQFVTCLCLHTLDDQQWPGALVLCKSAYSILLCTACQELVHFRFVSTATVLILPDVMPKKFRFVCPFRHSVRHRPGQAWSCFALEPNQVENRTVTVFMSFVQNR